MGDFSNTYSYNPGAYGTLEPNLIEGIKGLNYITGGIRAAAFAEKFKEQTGHIFTDAWGGPPFYDAVWIVANADQPRQQHRPQEDPRRDVARRLSLFRRVG